MEGKIILKSICPIYISGSDELRVQMMHVMTSTINVPIKQRKHLDTDPPSAHGGSNTNWSHRHQLATKFSDHCTVLSRRTLPHSPPPIIYDLSI